MINLFSLQNEDFTSSFHDFKIFPYQTSGKKNKNRPPLNFPPSLKSHLVGISTAHTSLKTKEKKKKSKNSYKHQIPQLTASSALQVSSCNFKVILSLFKRYMGNKSHSLPSPPNGTKSVRASWGSHS